MKQFLLSIPKTSIASILGALIVFGQAKGYIDGDTAMLISSILTALGISANIAVSKMRNGTR